MVNILKALMEKVNIMQEQMGNVGTDMDILRRTKIEMLEMKNPNTRNSSNIA